VNPFLNAVRRIGLAGLALPMLIVMILAMMILPLPPFVLDLLFTFNIAVSLVVLLAAISTKRPLDFAAFPTVLLLTTLLRLSLNVASTRVVLLNGHTGPDAAGKVIESFGHFLVGGNFAVGIVVFAILVVINFVVITKGAGRIAEVSARFTLDAMPGKQMAIDADLNAGLIGEADARRRRAEVAQEAEFYGSMDGASKFVRGDAIAGILVLFINVIGGLAIGMLQHNLAFATALNNYVLLAIGDGLVAQVPALVISTAAGLLVTRVVGAGAEREDVGAQLAGQLLQSPQAFGISAVLLGVMGIIPGMPHFPFLLGAGVLGYGAWWLGERRKGPAREPAPTAAPASSEEVSWDDLQPVDTLGLEVGYRLVPLVDKAQGGDLLKRIRAIRRKFAQEVGFLPPPVHIRDNLELKPGAYRVTLKGVAIGEGEVMSGALLAIDPGGARGKLPGTPGKDPAFGMPATWIDAAHRDLAQASGYTVVDASSVVATHVSHLLGTHAAGLIGRAETQQLLEHFSKHSPKLAEEVVPKLVPLSMLQRVLQNLLDEGVTIRDLRTILETVAEHAPRTQDAGELTAAIRIALGSAIAQQLFGSSRELQVVALEPELERLLQQGAPGAGDALEPGLADALMRSASAAALRQEGLGLAPALLVPDRLRSPLARMLKRAAPRLRVLSHAEVPDDWTVRVAYTLGAKA